ncbi:phage portal protein [Saccharopolyspora sp. NPDC002376]
MPLPSNGAEWPPRQYAGALARMNEHDAWYAGDPDRIARVYTNRRSGPTNRPSQYRGGIVGTLSRWFWGAPIPAGEKRAKLHLPLPADIATASSDLLFSEAPRITFDNATNAARWDTIAEGIGLQARLSEAAEVAAPLGGVYLRAGWDHDLAKQPLLAIVHADRALPEFSPYGRLRAVTFWRELENDGSTVLRLVERHELDNGRAVTLYGLYEGSDDKLGREIDLAGHPDAAGYEPVVDIGLPVLPVVYVPNMLPSRVDRASQLGRSDFESVEPLFDQLDEVLTSWMRDVRLAKGRIIVPSAFLQNLGPGQGAAFDPEREAYEALDVPPTSSAAGITVQQFAIRVAEHERTLDRLIRHAVETAGYSAQTFGLGTDGQSVTATEVRSRERRSYTTRGKKAGYWAPGLRDLATALLYVDRLVFKTPGVEPAPPAIEFPDGVQENPLQLAQTLRELETAGAVSTFVKVSMLHPEWDEDRITEEVERIRAEQGADGFDPVAAMRSAAATGDPVAGDEDQAGPADQ